MGHTQHVERLFSRVSSYGAFCVSPDRTVLTWNPGVRAILGYERDEFVGISADRLFTETDRLAGVPERELAQAERSGESCDDRWHLHRDGSCVYVAGLVTMLPDDRGGERRFVKLIRRRTHLVEASRLLHERSDRAEADSREKEAQMAVLAHELRQPLTAMLGWASMGASGRLPQERVTQIFARIRVAAESMIRVVTDLADAARIAAGKLELVSGPTDLVAIAQETVVELRLDAESRHIRISVDAPPACTVIADAMRLRQVIRNLLGNAVKYTPPYGSAHVGVRCEGKEATLTVADTGTGIDPQDLPHIFDRFRQSHDAGQSQSGLGIGLWLVREIVQRHGGTVAASSQGRGRGSVFTVTLPAGPAVSSHAGSAGGSRAVSTL